jgi:lysophospholipase L1-like esterase
MTISIPRAIRIPLARARRKLLPALALLLVASAAGANTLTQNVSWTIDRAGTATKYRVVAYGDSIYAGYHGSTLTAAKYSAPTVDAEYLSAVWNADIESVRRAKSGAVASDIYNNKIVAERSYMQASSTRVVTFEMCGNDGLQARSAFQGPDRHVQLRGDGRRGDHVQDLRRDGDGLHQRQRVPRDQGEGRLEPALPRLCR